MTQPTLFELITVTTVAEIKCHDCGSTVGEMDTLLPHSCERDLACQRCCHDCHRAALGRIMRRESPLPSVNAGRPIRGGRR